MLGPENKWVEVQIRTERMDEIAEHGLAAHWRYKGVKSESGIDEWLGNIRAALAEQGIENPTVAELRQTITDIRNAKLPDPKKIGNAGSFFMNLLFLRLNTRS